MCRLLKANSDKNIFLCHEVRTQQREAQFVRMINDAGLRVHQQRVATYSSCSDASGDAFLSGFVSDGGEACGGGCSRISGDGMRLTAQSSTELDSDNRDVVVLKVFSQLP
jgi:hypothetical protein